MLRSVKSLFGYRIQGLDGQRGILRDLYFNDQSWKVNYYVAYLSGRIYSKQVLITPAAVRKVVSSMGLLHVELTRQEIEQSPSINTVQPVSRQYETMFYRFPGALRSPVGAAGSDPHLRSLSTILGYAIKDQNGQLGVVDDFLVEDERWEIAYLGLRRPEEDQAGTIIPVRHVRGISWAGSTVVLSPTESGALSQAS